MSRIEHVLDFWFSEESKPFWFVRDRAFDERVRLRLADLSDLAMGNGLEGWRGSPRGTLAFILLLDQVPRNLHRNSPQAYAGDPLALEAATEAVDRGFDQDLQQVERLFLYLPFQHSEDLALQEKSCRLFATLDQDPTWYDYALQHKAIIERFGRFPHRNAVLGRTSSEAEERFLAEDPNSSF